MVVVILFVNVLAMIIVFGIIKKPSSVYRDNPSERNKMEGKRVIFIEDDNGDENADGKKGHLEAIGEIKPEPKVYDRFFKRSIDILLSLLGLLILSPLFLILALLIYLDDPGPVLFSQKRVGRNKQFFKLHKFRSMKMSTPHDKPTHMLENPDQYITKVGRFIRSHSLDELPQIWDIFLGNMSIIGPRPALWNQDWLIAERDKWDANDIRPGLTGWAQINGRDELEIPEKAKLDGEYRETESLSTDIKCFFGTFLSVARGDGFVEGGTGSMNKRRRQ